MYVDNFGTSCAMLLHWWSLVFVYSYSLLYLHFFLFWAQQPGHFFYSYGDDCSSSLISVSSALVVAIHDWVTVPHGTSCAKQEERKEKLRRQWKPLPTHYLRGLQGVTRMAYSPSLWLMAIGWWNKINQCQKLKLNLTQTWGVCMSLDSGMHWSQKSDTVTTN